ncbi:unnamed protein product [Didymodactylos carnosus]|uniref:polynucleotide adenylyltransferase n=1 Tax=Didymodactylos carnosus TaxID=1234261 RepID=A0A8S2P2I6_9BILA|nr:unnamed protein product [Didymodactylos carnosus]CAF4024958.1 unnamed protein product [Didymodactylos carnosus]
MSPPTTHLLIRSKTTHDLNKMTKETTEKDNNNLLLLSNSLSSSLNSLPTTESYSSSQQTPSSSLSKASSYSSLINDDLFHSSSLSTSSPQSSTPEDEIEEESEDLTTPVEKHKTMPLPVNKNELLTTRERFLPKKRTLHYTQSVLTHTHLAKLCPILEDTIEIHGNGNFPTLNIRPKQFVLDLRKLFQQNNIDILDIRLNGGKCLLIFLYLLTIANK